jgi:hypothetical protein
LKVIKELTHALFMRPLGLQGNLFLSVAVGCFFDLKQPERIGTEIDMWKLAAETLGKDTLLDEGNPKLVGEFLACGQCWSATGAPITSSEVGIRVGNVAKNLYVFGDREWLPAGSETPLSMSQPKPFVSMPLDSAHAFGGESYTMNPYGKGLQPNVPFDYWPLPNIETGAFIQSTSNRPEPAGYGMLGFMDPRRYCNMGTYDQYWLENRWPFYPDDFDPCYFNCASPDQRLKQGYFFPGDEIRIYHMHPSEALLLSHLPLIRQRAFIRQQQGEHLMFVETPLQIDTVWLWPEQQRGLTLARGVFPIADDDADDVKLIFTATEPALATPRSIEEWEQELSERLQRAVPYDLSPLMPGLDEELQASEKNLKAIPDTLRKMKDEMDFDKAFLPMPETTPASLLEENRQIQAEIDALMRAPVFGSAEQIALYRKIMRSKLEMSKALGEVEDSKSQLKPEIQALDNVAADDIKTEESMAEMYQQIAGIKERDPAAYEKALRQLDEAKAKMTALAATNIPVQKASFSETQTGANLLPMRPSERLKQALLDKQAQKNALLQQVDLLAVEPEATVSAQRETLDRQLAMVEYGMEQIQSALEGIMEANADKNAMLEKFVAMTEEMTKDIKLKK